MEKWWNEIINYSHRDQLSFNYILWKEHKKVKYIHWFLIKKIAEQGQHIMDVSHKLHYKYFFNLIYN